MIAFRVDANETIASGHIMRCIAIARKLIQMGQECVFLVSDTFALELIQLQGIAYECLNVDWKKSYSELPIVEKSCKKYKVDVLVVDSYEVDSFYLEGLHKFVKVVYIDDLIKVNAKIDLLINYTRKLPSNIYEFYYKNGIRVLLGSKYTPLRDEFDGNLININEEVSNVFITTGGSDSRHFVQYFLQSIIYDNSYNDLQFHIIVGSLFDNKDVLEKLASVARNIHLYQNIKSISKVMRKCDIAISAGGTTLAELCSCGIPTICFAISDNQEDSVSQYHKDEIMYSIGSIEEDIETFICRAKESMELFVNFYDIRKKYAENARKVIDGKGTFRIAKEIIQLIKAI